MTRSEFRTVPRPADIPAVRALVEATRMFRPAEVAIAVELVEEALAKGAEASGYCFVLADGKERLDGYACYGPIAGSRHSFDLYWIAVDPLGQRRGLGHQLMAAVEEAILRAGGRRIYVDTSSTLHYAPTRAFYAACGYQVAAELPDFYADADGKVIFCKVLAW